jgi:hypothetical protein
LKFLEIGGTDTIGILKKEFPYLFQHFTKIQRSFSKIELNRGRSSEFDWCRLWGLYG